MLKIMHFIFLQILASVLLKKLLRLVHRKVCVMCILLLELQIFGLGWGMHKIPLPPVPPGYPWFSLIGYLVFTLFGRNCRR